MEEQMRMAFMQDSGSDVEPTTGNEIPPGSLEDEVKDDVDAKLSEGEFVVPADVVQFYGVKYLTGMIDKAKEKLGELDQKGQIGGDKPPAEEDPEEELPFDVSELQTAEEDAPVEMAEGGLVQPWMRDQKHEEQKRPWLYQTGGNTNKDNTQHGKEVGVAQDISKWGPDEFESFANGRDIFRKATQLGGLAAGPAGALFGAFARKMHDRTLDKATEALDQRLEDENLDPKDRERYSSIRESYSEIQNEDRDGFFGGARDTPAARMGLYGEDKIPFNEGLFSWRKEREKEEDQQKEQTQEKKKESKKESNKRESSSGEGSEAGLSRAKNTQSSKRDDNKSSFSKGGLVKKPATRK